MKTVDISANVNWNDLLDDVQNDDVVLFRGGQPVAKLERFDADDLDDFRYEQSEAAIQRGQRARQEYENGGTIPICEVKRQLQG